MRSDLPVLAEGFVGIESRRRSWARALIRRKIVLLGLVIIALMVAGALFAPWLAPHDPLRQNLAFRNVPPVGLSGSDIAFPFGTDPLGRDILSRLLYGARVSLVVAFSAVVLQGLIGVVTGLLAGYYGGWIDNVIMRVVDIQLGLPFLVLTIAVAVVLGGGLTNIVIVLTLTGWVFYARVVRSEVLSLRERDFILASKVSGSRTSYILLRHMVPNILSSAIVLATFMVARMIITESSLSFLGLGIQPPTPAWGSMVAEGRNYLGSAWWVATLPGLAIMATGLAANLVGDWLRDVLDPGMSSEA